MPEPLLSVSDLVVRYRRAGLFASPAAPAVNAVSFSVNPGETLGIVGESGSGKSSLLRAILRLVPVESGAIRLGGADWLNLSGAELQAQRGDIGVVAQNPYLSLSPRLTIAEIIAEPMQAQAVVKRSELRDRAGELLEQCGLPADFLTRKARELSGGQAQRVAFARALATNPKLLILDEPTSALDVSVQAQILNLLEDLRLKFGLTMVFVTHNLKVVRHVSDRLLVMRQGAVIEAGATEQIVTNPAQDYTRELMGIDTKATRADLFDTALGPKKVAGRADDGQRISDAGRALGLHVARVQKTGETKTGSTSSDNATASLGHEDL